jgi:hypothetical protein
MADYREWMADYRFEHFGPIQKFLGRSKILVDWKNFLRVAQTLATPAKHPVPDGRCVKVVRALSTIAA